MKNILNVCATVIVLFLLNSCAPPKRTGASNWAKTYPSAVGIATEDARVYSLGNNIVACKFFLRVPPYGLVEFEPNSSSGMFTVSSRGSCSLVRKDDTMEVAVTAYFRDNDQSPYKWSFEAKGIFGEPSPSNL